TFRFSTRLGFYQRFSAVPPHAGYLNRVGGASKSNRLNIVFVPGLGASLLDDLKTRPHLLGFLRIVDHITNYPKITFNDYVAWDNNVTVLIMFEGRHRQGVALVIIARGWLGRMLFKFFWCISLFPLTSLHTTNRSSIFTHAF